MWKLIFLLASFSGLLGGCSGTRTSGNGEAGPLIALSIEPQAYFASRIGGDRAAYLVLVGPGSNPHSYEPGPRLMAELARAKCWVLAGIEFEIGFKPKAAALFPDLPIIDGSRGALFRALDEAGDEAPGHGHEGDGGIDRHIWLGHENTKVLAGHILEALLSGADGRDAEFFRENHEALIRDIDREFDALREELAPLRGKTVLVYHPAFGYFLDEFGIRQKAVETGGREPTPRILSTLIEEARREKVRIIFTQTQFPLEAARTVAAAAGAEIAALDPLARDWLANIRLMGEALKTAIQEDADD